MSGNLIACIVFLVIGILLLIMAAYHFIKMLKTDEVYRIIPTMFFSVIGGMLVLAAALHWNDDREYKVIVCKEYKIEQVTITKNDSVVIDKTYKISYR